MLQSTLPPADVHAAVVLLGAAAAECVKGGGARGGAPGEAPPAPHRAPPSPPLDSRFMGLSGEGSSAAGAPGLGCGGRRGRTRLRRVGGGLGCGAPLPASGAG